MISWKYIVFCFKDIPYPWLYNTFVIAPINHLKTELGYVWSILLIFFLLSYYNLDVLCKHHLLWLNYWLPSLRKMYKNWFCAFLTWNVISKFHLRFTKIKGFRVILRDDLNLLRSAISTKGYVQTYKKKLGSYSKKNVND